MATTDPLLFSLTALRPTGAGLSGASVRILNANSDDVTSVLFGSSTHITDASGLVTKSFTALTGVPVGQTYTIQVTATGYETWTTGTSTAWRGEGIYIANLVKSTTPAGDYVLTEPEHAYCSSLYSIVGNTLSPISDAWELIRYHVTHLDSRTSILECPVDPSTSIATADFHSRARLKPVPVLVADANTSAIDPNFSDELTVTIESLTEDGTISLPGTFSVGVANMVPDLADNDLGNYAIGVGDGPLKWISLLKEPVLFRNHYFDTMIWLTDVGEEYTLHTSYFNAANVQVGSTITETLLGHKQVRRIRLDADPASSVRYAHLWVTQDSSLISETLTVHYRG